MLHIIVVGTSWQHPITSYLQLEWLFVLRYEVDAESSYTHDASATCVGWRWRRIPFK